MISLMVDQKVFSELITIYLCELDEKFKELCLEPSIFSLQWFVCLFSCTVEQEVPSSKHHLFTIPLILKFQHKVTQSDMGPIIPQRTSGIP